jgi:hypothetical protein
MKRRSSMILVARALSAQRLNNNRMASMEQVAGRMFAGTIKQERQQRMDTSEDGTGLQ